MALQWWNCWTINCLKRWLWGQRSKLSRGQNKPFPVFIMIAFVLEVQSPSLISVWDIWTNCLVRRCWISLLLNLCLKRYYLFQEAFQVPKTELVPLFRAPTLSYTNLYTQHHKCAYWTLWSPRPDTGHRSSLCPSCLSPGPGCGGSSGWVSVE